MKTLPSLRILFLLFSSLILLSSCEDDDDPCEDCQAAINHMCEKIQDNNCNPDFMASALSRLREDCGTAVGNDYAGYMQHTCAFETLLSCPTCNDVDGNIVADLAVVNVDFTILSNLPDDATYRLRLQAVNQQGESLLQETLDEKNLNAVSTQPFQNDRNVYATLELLELREDGSVESITIVTDRTEMFDLYRPGKWFNPRTIRVSYDDFSEQYLIEFIDW